MSNQSIKGLPGALVFGAVSALMPQATLAEGNTLDTVVVTGRRAEARLEDTPQRIEVITKKDIERTPARELTDLLKKNTSVDVIQYPGNLSGIGIRGFRPEFSGINKRSLLLIDGRPAMATNLSLVNMDNIERVEVLKGPASALYGSSAMGGVVNLITRERRGELGGFAQVGYGSYDTREIRGSVGGALSRFFDFDYSGSYFDQNDDFKMGDGNVRPNTAYSQQNHALRLGFNLSEDWRLLLSSDLYRGRDIATPGDLSKGTNAQSNKDMDRQGNDLKLTGRLGAHRLSLRAFGGEQSYESYTKTTTTAADKKYLPFRSFDEVLEYSGWQVQDQWAWSDWGMTVIGIDQETARQTTRSYQANGARKAPSSANNQRESLGYYVQNAFFLNEGNTTIDVGLRRDQITTKTFATPLLTSFQPGEAEFSTTNPSIGFKQRLIGDLRLHGTAGKGFVPPSAGELTGSAITVKAPKNDVLSGNAGLKPESSVTWDLGLEWSSGGVFVDLTVFRTKVRDKITRVQIGEDAGNRYYSYANANTAQMEGLEWNGRWQAADFLTLSVSGTHYFKREEELSGGRATIRNVPDNILRAAADVQQGAWSGRLGMRYVGEFFDNDWNGNSSNIIAYKPFTVFDLSASYRIDRHQSVSLLVDNLFDRFYSEKGGYPLPGRNGRLAYRYSF
ncbi:TonB-dependent receptor plug domain-containing protein [Dechloromonas sp. ARDL1]|uniref:TonB-dependent receptor plug domain-containing protein n=1 Tax=Dechloromonas sp. ARDL1 TaxID=3322121 RepID=UPI003DA74D32